MRRLGAAVILSVVLACGACGGDEQAAETTAPQPTIPRAVAEDLAARSDAIADALDAGDVCTAAVRADELRRATLDAINNEQIPPEFLEDLTARANELVNSVNCPPPPTTTQEEDDGGGGEGSGETTTQATTTDQSSDEDGVTVPTIPELP
jgi:hypothetical protein